MFKIADVRAEKIVPMDVILPFFGKSLNRMYVILDMTEGYYFYLNFKNTSKITSPSIWADNLV